MTYEEIKKYAKNLLWANRSAMSRITVEDVVQEAYLTPDGRGIKQHLQRYVITEKHKANAEKQRNAIPQPYQKVCKACGEVKDSSEFYRKFDVRYGLEGLESKCKHCFNRDPKRLERNKKYRNTPKGKAQAKLRYERWKNKHRRDVSL